MLKEMKRKRGRPKKSNSKKNCVKSWLNDYDVSRLERCLNIKEMSKSKFVRLAVQNEMNNILSRFESAMEENEYENYDYYCDEDYEDYEDYENDDC